MGAGYTPGVPRLGIPALLMTDASLGVTNPGYRPGDTATALPAALALGASFNPTLAREAGAMLGREARVRGFNVLLGGGINLARDPRNGRNFEYLSEDPLLSAVLAAEVINGTQGEGVISTIKHYSLNCNETNRHWLDAIIDPAAHRESDLLAFQMAIEWAQPGAVMSGYNKINGDYAGGNHHLLNEVLKGAWGYKGWVMSDWGATPSWDYALKGLDQESGVQMDVMMWGTESFVEPLKAAYAEGKLPKERLSDMVRRILRSMYAVVPPGGHAAVIKIGGPGIMGGARNLYLLPSSPIAEIKKLLPKVQIEFDPGQSPAESTLLARRSDVVIVFGIRVEGEGFDLPDLTLPWGQDAVIEAVASANPHTIVVLETGNPVAMPWRDRVKAIVQAWYPGQAGGQAIAEVLTGTVNPSGRLPITFPADLAQTPRPALPGLGTPWGTPTTIRYDEGSEVGYRWFAQKGEKPLYAFGHGLSYTSFAYRDLQVSGGETITVSFTVTNTATREGADVPQLYLTDAPGQQRLRLLGFERVQLRPGESRRVTVTAEPRLLARLEAGAEQWRIATGTYRVALGKSANDLVLTGSARLTSRLFGT
jgi:beta-glucosidase